MSAPPRVDRSAHGTRGCRRCWPFFGIAVAARARRMGFSGCNESGERGAKGILNGAALKAQVAALVDALDSRTRGAAPNRRRAGLAPIQRFPSVEHPREP